METSAYPSSRHRPSRSGGTELRFPEISAPPWTQTTTGRTVASSAR